MIDFAQQLNGWGSIMPDIKQITVEDLFPKTQPYTYGATQGYPTLFNRLRNNINQQKYNKQCTYEELVKINKTADFSRVKTNLINKIMNELVPLLNKNYQCYQANIKNVDDEAHKQVISQLQRSLLHIIRLGTYTKKPPLPAFLVSSKLPNSQEINKTLKEIKKVHGTARNILIKEEKEKKRTNRYSCTF